MAQKRTNRLESQDWQRVFVTMVLKSVNLILAKLKEYQRLGPQSVNYTVRAGIDASTSGIEGKRDIFRSRLGHYEME